MRSISILWCRLFGFDVKMISLLDIKVSAQIIFTLFFRVANGWRQALVSSISDVSAGRRCESCIEITCLDQMFVSKPWFLIVFYNRIRFSNVFLLCVF